MVTCAITEVAIVLNPADDVAIAKKEIEARGYDLKAVNPNAKRNEDTRTPEELLDVIEAKGREVAEALTALRALTGKKV